MCFYTKCIKNIMNYRSPGLIKEPSQCCDLDTDPCCSEGVPSFLKSFTCGSPRFCEPVSSQTVPTVHRSRFMLQDALCCSSGLFQQVLSASAGCFTSCFIFLSFSTKDFAPSSVLKLPRLNAISLTYSQFG